MKRGLPGIQPEYSQVYPHAHTHPRHLLHITQDMGMERAPHKGHQTLRGHDALHPAF